MNTDPLASGADFAISSATGYHRQADATLAAVAAATTVIVNLTGIGPGRPAGAATDGSISIVP
ncbi:MAG TPA: hypothetical protein VFY18_07345 [Candidatus Limnocylindrales bacterium]|nr:hypothetical protein [Candidatus Limnocylindrales bacterium]